MRCDYGVVAKPRCEQDQLTRVCTTGVASYEWGKVGSTSAAGRFAAATPRDGFQIENEKPYAEVCCTFGLEGKHPY